ncbi:phosphoribosylamine--glycine ligase [Limisphaera sp. VF-2]|jgi:phosphoribosylamine--glycine ligase|uniref:phosphoribosylamine--glycine ligase n=1 Tax=Limisphaera sp. VF-2 TaxID=3400418 RepID=UPI00176A71E9
MKVLVIGGGGREHALVWKLAQSPHVTDLYCAPGNAGIASERIRHNGAPVHCVPIGAEDLPTLVAWAREQRPDLTVVGPDNPLALGVVDRFQAEGLRAWGPTRVAAQFEASKVFAQQFMERYGIPAPRGAVFEDPRAASRYAASLGGRCAVKADGLALGKGVRVCRNQAEADAAIEDWMVRRLLGPAGARVVIQELLEGIEVSLHALCDGRTALPFPTSQDHKRLKDGDTGPNTGGMGTYCPTPFLDETQLAQAYAQILQPWLKGCQAEGIDFRGLLYPGVMLTANGPRVLEFNVRFGDPETQVYLTRLENDLFELLWASAEGSLPSAPLRWSAQTSVCIVLASAGYPGDYRKGCPISGLEEAEQIPGVKVFHAGTDRVNGQWVTKGGRVLGVTALAPDLPAALQKAYAAVERIHFDGMQYRRDIGHRALRWQRP